MNELRIGTASGNYIYANAISPSSRRWTGTVFESYASAHFSSYAIRIIEQGSSGVYVGDFPGVEAANYEIFYYIADNGGSAVEGDHIAGIGSINWDGTSIIPPNAAVSGEESASDWLAYIKRTFRRPDKDLETYDATNEAIAEIRRSFATAREEKETALTQQIDTLGQYKMDVESDFGLSVSDVFIRDRSQGRFLLPISKPMFDYLYSKWNTDAGHRAKPIHYCLFGGQILVGPVPNLTSYTYVVSYSKDDRVLVTATTVSVPFTTTDYREILKHGVLMRLYSLVENDAQAQKYGAFWLKGLKDIERKEDRNRRITTIAGYNDF